VGYFGPPQKVPRGHALQPAETATSLFPERSGCIDRILRQSVQTTQAVQPAETAPTRLFPVRSGCIDRIVLRTQAVSADNTSSAACGKSTNKEWSQKGQGVLTELGRHVCCTHAAWQTHLQATQMMQAITTAAAASLPLTVAAFDAWQAGAACAPMLSTTASSDRPDTGQLGFATAQLKSMKSYLGVVGWGLG
jgi:hypothetical protein